MKPYSRYTPREPGLLKPHTVVYHRVDRSFYEVCNKGLTPHCYLAALITENGTIVTWNQNRIYRQDVEVVSPAHPVYIRWAARRLQDRLEGLDRT